VLEARDEISIAAYSPEGEEQPLIGPMVEMHLLRGAHLDGDSTAYAGAKATALDIVARRLTRHSNPPRIVKFRQGPKGSNYELGQTLFLTHYGGVGAEGWVDRPLRMLKHELNPNNLEVYHEMFDLHFLLSTIAILMDETVMAEFYDDATDDDKEDGFYLGDETTGLLPDGSPMKRLT
jgi:hypothetical protein